MVSFWKVFSVVAVGVQSRRVAREIPAVSFGGVPVLNFDLAFEDHLSLVEQTEKEVDWLVVTRAGTTDAQIAALCSQATCLEKGHPDEQGVQFFEIRGTVGVLKALLENADDLVEFAEPDLEVRLNPEPDLDEASGNNMGVWGLERVGVPTRPTSAGAGVTVFILDSGVRTSHQDFGSRAIPHLDVTTSGSSDCRGDNDCAQDSIGHGTHCAAIAGGTQHGVAPMATIRAVKIINNEKIGFFTWIVSALDSLASSSDRPAVASMSIGRRRVNSEQSAAERTAVNAAVDAGMTVVVAAGNENENSCNFSPAFITSAITVGSTNRKNRRSSFSNFGPCTDIWAPGSNIKSASFKDDTATARKSGTSMACPHVAGAAALILADKGGLSPAKVMESLSHNSIKNLIMMSESSDPKFLYVGDRCAFGGRQAKVLKNGLCRCFHGTKCHRPDGTLRCDNGKWMSTDRFLPTCNTCTCK